MNVGSKTNLFPLSHVLVGLNGYFIDVVGDVWSTRKKSEPQKLTARNGFVQLTYLGGQRSYGVGGLLSSARAQTTWKAETGTVKSVPEVKSVAKTETAKPAVKPVGWIIGSLTAEGSFSFAATPKVQSTEADVKAELERLAKAYPGKTFVSFKIEKSATAGGIVWG
jgi:hypothetical protein